MTTFKLARASHCVGESNFHIQLTVAYRRPVFADPRVAKLTEAYILAKAEGLGIAIAHMGFGKDHLHIFAMNCRRYGVDQLVGLIKGFTSRMMRKNHKALIRHMLWGKKFWTDGYFYRSVGQVTSENMAYYVGHSQRRHWEVVDEEFYAHANGQSSIGQFAGPPGL